MPHAQCINGDIIFNLGILQILVDQLHAADQRRQNEISGRYILQL